MPRFWNTRTRPDMITYPLPSTLIGIRTGEYVEACLEPIRNSLRDFHRLMELVFSSVNAIRDALAALDCEVAMQFDHGGARILRFGRISLDFVVSLRQRQGGGSEKENG